ncbi:MAG: pilus assembly protein PilM [Candidatus Omnitrophota bacterium]
MSIFKKGTQAVGLDINQETITVIEIAKSKQGFVLKNIAACPTPSGSIEKGIIVNPKALGKTIKELFIKNNIKSRQATVAVWGPGALVHLSKIPAIPDKEIKEALKSEVSHYIVFAGGETVTDTYKLEEIIDNGVKKTQVLLGVAKKDVVNSYVEAAKYAGLELIAIDIGCLAVMRALYSNALRAQSNEAVVLATVETENTVLSVLRGGILSYSYNIDAGSRDREFASKLTFELKSVINYYQSEHTEVVKKIVIAGEIQKLGAIEKDLSAEFAGIGVEKGLVGADIQYDKSASPFSVRAVGLAMLAKGVGEYPVKINLLPAEEIKIQEAKIQVLKFLIALCFLIFLILISFAAIKLSIKATASKILVIQQQLEKPSPQLQRLLGIEQGARAYTGEIEKQNGIIDTAGKAKASDLLDEIRRLTPKDARLIKLTKKENTVIFSGEAVSQEAVFNFVRSLKGSGYFEEAKLQTAESKSDQEKTYIDFAIICQLSSGENQ